MGKEIIGLLFWSLFALYVAIESYRLDLGSWNAPDAGFVPFVAAFLLGLISLILLVKSLLKGGLQPREHSASRERLNWQDLSLTFLGMLVYILLMNWIGFVLCTFLLMVFLIWAVGKMSWCAALIASSSITAAFYLLFEILLDAQLPKGILEAFF